MPTTLHSHDIEPPEDVIRRVCDMNVTATDLDGEATYESCTLEGRVRDIHLVDARLERCSFRNAVLLDASLARVEVSDCTGTGVDASGATLRDVRISQSGLQYARAFGTRFQRCWFQDCDLREADFDSAAFDGVVFRNCDLRGARIASSRLGLVDLRGSRIDGLVVNTDLTRGLVIDPMQADIFAVMFGLRVERLQGDHGDHGDHGDDHVTR
jgi:uncharacterized protein YjbI with pentapeptide repeats